MKWIVEVRGWWRYCAACVCVAAMCVVAKSEEVLVRETEPVEAAYSTGLLLRCAFTVTNPGGGLISNAVTVLRIPRQKTSQHWTHRVRCSSPATIREDAIGNRELVVSTPNVAPYGNRVFTVGFELLTSLKSVGGVETNVQAFLVGQTEKSIPDWIKAGVKHRQTATVLATVSNLCFWVKGLGPDEGKARSVLPPELRCPRGGACVQAAETMAIACRLAGIPTRQIDGYVSHQNEVLSSLGYHSWVECWDGKGWVPADPSRGKFGHEACKGYIAFAVIPVSEESNWTGRFYWSETASANVEMRK